MRGATFRDGTCTARGSAIVASPLYANLCSCDLSFPLLSYPSSRIAEASIEQQPNQALSAGRGRCLSLPPLAAICSSRASKAFLTAGSFS